MGDDDIVLTDAQAVVLRVLYWDAKLVAKLRE